MRSSAGGSSGASELGGASSWQQIAIMLSTSVRRANSRRWVSISHSAMPTENTSERRSSGSRRICSGDM